LIFAVGISVITFDKLSFACSLSLVNMYCGQLDGFNISSLFFISLEFTINLPPNASNLALIRLAFISIVLASSLSSNKSGILTHITFHLSGL
jgi:hypothetical protein